MEPINSDVLNQGIATARGIGNALKVFRSIEEAISLYAQTQASIGDLTKAQEILAAEVSDLSSRRDAARLELDQQVAILAEYRKTEKAKIDGELHQARNKAQEQVLIAQGAVAKAQQDRDAALKEMRAELSAKKAEIEAAEKTLDALQVEIAALKQKFA